MNKTEVNNREYRRIKVKNVKKEQAAFDLAKQKSLSRDDIILLLETYELNQQSIFQ